MVESLLQRLVERFQSPEALLLLLSLPLLHLWSRRRGSRRGMIFGTLATLKQVPPSPSLRLLRLLPWLRLVALALLIVALARPRQGVEKEELLSEGIDIVLALDLSGSMQALDLMPRSVMEKLDGVDAEVFQQKFWPQYSRLGYAKRVLADFIGKRKGDRLGLIGFGGDAQVLCPPTLDHAMLEELVAQANHESVNPNGTAIGDALMSALRRMERSKAASKIVVLLTDGANNMGRVSPLKAAEVGKALGIKIYTIGVGKREGSVPTAMRNPFTGNLTWSEEPIRNEDLVDEGTLTQMARQSGGQYFRATDAQSLEEIYANIDQLERSEIRTRSYTNYREQFHPWLLAGALLLLIELLLGQTRLARLP